MLKLFKKFIKSNKCVFKSAKFIKRELVTRKIDNNAYASQKYKAAILYLAKIITKNNLTGGLITDNGDFYIKSEDSIWLYYNYNDDRFTQGDGQRLEFKSSYSLSSIETFILSYFQNGMYYFDIGANNGYYYSLKIANKYPQSRVYSFEPDCKILHHLKKNVEFNNLNNIEIHEIALSDNVGHAKLSKDMGASGFIVVDDNLVVDTINVQCTSLDIFLYDHNIPRIDLIKVDIEGGEFNFLKGAVNSLNKYKPLLILEVTENLLQRSNTSKLEIEFFLKSSGYRLAGIVKSNDVLAIPSERFDEIVKNNNLWLELPI